MNVVEIQIKTLFSGGGEGDLRIEGVGGRWGLISSVLKAQWTPDLSVFPKIIAQTTATS